MCGQDITSILVESPNDFNTEDTSQYLAEKYELPREKMEKITEIINEPRIDILSDLPVDDDSLNFRTLVRTLSNVVFSESTQTPLTIAVDGEWGSGKTSILKMIEAQARALDIPCIWLNAWNIEDQKSLLDMVHNEIEQEFQISAVTQQDLRDDLSIWREKPLTVEFGQLIKKILAHEVEQKRLVEEKQARLEALLAHKRLLDYSKQRPELIRELADNFELVRELADNPALIRELADNPALVITPNLHRKLRDTLLECGLFDTDRQLQAIFVDERLYLWMGRLPRADNLAHQVDLIIDYLRNKYNKNGDNALVLLLRVLSEELDPRDRCHQRMVGLADEMGLVRPQVLKTRLVKSFSYSSNFVRALTDTPELVKVLTDSFDFFDSFKRDQEFLQWFNDNPENFAAHARKKMSNLVNSFRSASRFIIFVDDIDRAFPEQITTTLKSLKLILESPYCIFILAMDVDIVARSLENHYQQHQQQLLVTNLNHVQTDILHLHQTQQDEQTAHTFGHSYLEKLIQIRVEVPTLTREAVVQYLEDFGVAGPIREIIRWAPEQEVLNPRRLKRYLNWLSIALQLLVSTLALTISNLNVLRLLALKSDYPRLYKALVEKPIDELDFRNFDTGLPNEEHEFREYLHEFTHHVNEFEEVISNMPILNIKRRKN